MAKPFDQVVQFASRNTGEGVLVEPRFYYDILDFPRLVDSSGPSPDSTIVANSDPGAYVNAEQFPVRLTQMIVSVLPMIQPDNPEVLVYPALSDVQKVFLRVERYGEFYMSEIPLRAVNFANKNVAPPTSTGQGTVMHKFHTPVVLASRDSFRVEFSLSTPLGYNSVWFPPYGDGTLGQSGAAVIEPGNLRCNVQFAGVGMISGRPYVFGGEGTFVGGSWVVDSAQMINASNEPVAITQVTASANFNVALVFNPIFPDALPPGTFPADVRFMSIQIRQQGNGTQANWMRGPTNPVNITRMPLSLLGTDMGSAVVHEIPGDGLTLEPGETVRVQGNFALPELPAEVPMPQFRFPVYVAFAGYIMVT
jgi:hypothetical protein